MPNLKNLTPFAAVDLLSMTKQGAKALVVCVAGRFQLPPADQPSSEPPSPCAEQLPPPLSDLYWGEPGKSSLRHEAQTTYWRPGTDIYVSGQAWAPRGRPVKDVLVAVRVGPCRKGVQVFGDRVWSRGLLGLKPSEPRPFESMPLVYERSLGGNALTGGGHSALHESRNPVGRGLYASSRDAVDMPLPNLENPLHLLKSPTERIEPAGLGPIARSWQPRMCLAGTYDDTWVARRAPLWPTDFDERFFMAAAPGLSATPHLQGGEEVVLTGLSPDGRFAFPLPRHRLMMKACFNHRVERRCLILDAIHLEPDEGAMTLFWRTAIELNRDLERYEYGIVRQMEPWEELPT
ncbi:DUF2169 domain-containing protein [Archangium violaceum]|nr:DUF2169 domain-containing protein [Archangium violaceum]